MSAATDIVIRPVHNDTTTSWTRCAPIGATVTIGGDAKDGIYLPGIKPAAASLGRLGDGEVMLIRWFPSDAMTVNREPIKAFAVIHDGDEITIGSHALRIVSGCGTREAEGPALPVLPDGWSWDYAFGGWNALDAKGGGCSRRDGRGLGWDRSGDLVAVPMEVWDAVQAASRMPKTAKRPGTSAPEAAPTSRAWVDGDIGYTWRTADDGIMLDVSVETIRAEMPITEHQWREMGEAAGWLLGEVIDAEFVEPAEPVPLTTPVDPELDIATRLGRALLTVWLTGRRRENLSYYVPALERDAAALLNYAATGSLHNTGRVRFAAEHGDLDGFLERLIECVTGHPATTPSTLRRIDDDDDGIPF